MPDVYEPITVCQKCGKSQVWDNRQNKLNPKGPDFKCKDKNCAEGFWLKDPKDGPGQGDKGESRAKQETQVASVITVGMLAEKMSEAHEALQPFFGALTVDESGAVLGTIYKMAFTELKGKVG